MADNINQNVAILSLMAKLEDNSKEISVQAKKMISKVEKTAGTIEFGADTKEIQNAIEKINKLIDGKLKGIDLTKQFGSILKVFSNAESSAEDYLNILDKVHNELNSISKLPKNSLNLMSDFSPKQIEQVLKVYDKLIDKQEKYTKKQEETRKKAQAIEAESLLSLKRRYSAESSYKNASTDGALSLLSKQIGLEGNTSAKQDIKEYSQLLSIFNLLQDRKKELATMNTAKDAEEEVKINKTLLSIVNEIATKEKRLSSAFGAKDLLSSSLEGFDTGQIEYSILRSIDAYAQRASKVVKDSVTQLQNDLDQTILDYSQKNIDRMIASQEKDSERVQARINKRMSSMSSAKTSQDSGNVLDISKDASENVQKLDNALENIGDDSGSNELDLWAKSAENLKEEFADVIKYAVDAETALEKVNELMDKQNPLKGNTALSRDEKIDLLGYIQRLGALDAETTEEMNKFFQVNKGMPGFKKIEGIIWEMTEKQLEEIEKLKVAKKELTEQPISDSSSTSVVEKQIEETTEAVEELVQAEKKVEEQSGSFYEVSEQANVLKDSLINVKDNINAITAEPFVKLSDEISNATNKVNELSESLKNVVSSSSNGIGKTVKDWNDSDVLMKEHSELRERKAFGNSQTGYMTNAYSSGKQHGFSGKLAKKIFESAEQQVDSMIHSHSFDVAAFSSEDIQALKKYLDRGVSKSYVKAFKEVAEFDMSKMSKTDLSKVDELIRIQAESEEILKKDVLDKVNIYENLITSINEKTFISGVTGTIDNIDNISNIPNTIKDSIYQTVDANVESVVNSFRNDKTRIDAGKFTTELTNSVTRELDNFVTNNDIDANTLIQINEAKGKIYAEILAEVNGAINKISVGANEEYQVALKDSLLNNMKKLNIGNIDEILKTHSIDDFIKDNTFGSNGNFLGLDGVKVGVTPNVDPDVFISTIEQKISGKPVKVDVQIDKIDEKEKIVEELSSTSLSPENQSTVLSGDQSSVLSGNQTPLSSDSSAIIEENKEVIKSNEEVIASEEKVKKYRIANRTDVPKIKSNVDPIKDTFDFSTESSEMDKVATATDEAIQSKKDFATANEGVQDSVDGSKSKLQLEAELMESIAKNAREAANAKKEFVKANKEVETSADSSSDSIKDETNSIEDNTKASKDNANTKKKSKEKVPDGWIKNISKAYDAAIKEDNDRTGRTLLNNYNNIYDGLSSKNGKTNEYKIQLENLKTVISEINGLVPIKISDEQEKTKLEELNNQAKELVKDLDDAKKYDLADQMDIDKLSGNISDSLRKNTAAPKEITRQLEELRNKLKELGLSKADIEKIRESFVSLNSQMKATGKTGDSLGTKITRKFKDVAAYFATYVSIQDAIQVIRQGFETIKEYDVALTEMNKVSDETIQTLKEFQSESFELANSIGTTAAQIQNSTADFMRLGESLEEAKQSAQDANILFNVSEFGSIDEATESLVSMSQAYKELEKGEIIDVVNNLGNNFAISTDGLATALQNSASALKTAQNDFFEAAALTTAANTVVQDPDKVGAGLRTIALRLTGTEAAREELAALGEDVDDFVVTTTSKLDQQIKDLTKTQGNFGVSLLDMNGNYRSTYEVLLDIAKVWDKIAEEDLVTGENRQNALLEMMAGKNRANILASVLQSPEVLEEAYAYALDSEGSALKENEAYLESIQGHLDQLKNSWDNLWINENNREVITFFLDLAKSALDAANEFGALNTVLVGGGGIFAAIKAFQGNGRPKCRVLKLNMPLVA